ncbi:MAG TPA: hypothetical protein V6D47_07940 [Oscillatoriaceae cyanobacterium]
MYIRTCIAAATVPLACLSLVGCGNPLLSSAPKTGTKAASYVASADQDAMTLAESVVDGPTQDWRRLCIHSELIDRLRAEKAANTANTPSPNGEGGEHANVHSAKADMQFLGFFTDGSHGASHGYHTLNVINSNPLTSPIGGTPGIGAANDFFWVAKDGEVFTETNDTKPAYDFTITNPDDSPTTDTFTNVSVQIAGIYGSKANTDMLVCSDQGNFYVIDPYYPHVNGAHTVNVYPMGDTDSHVGYTAQPFVDYAQRPASANVAYVVTNKGMLYRFVVNYSTKTATYQSTRLPLTVPLGDPDYTELFAGTPLAFNGVVSLGSWIRANSSDRTQDEGVFYSFDVKSFPTLTSVFTAQPTTAPYLATPGGIYNTNTFALMYAFEPNGDHVDMFDVVGGTGQASSFPLIVNNNDPMSGSLLDTSAPVASDERYPGMQTQISINQGPSTWEVLVANCNALWKLDAGTASDTWAHRGLYFRNKTNTTYAKTYLGQTSTLSPSNMYVNNNCMISQVYPDTNSCYFLDSSGNASDSNDVSLNKFTLNQGSITTPPSLQLYKDLNLGNSATHYSGSLVNWNPDPSNQNVTELYFATLSNASDTPAAAAWDGFLP